MTLTMRFEGHCFVLLFVHMQMYKKNVLGRVKRIRSFVGGRFWWLGMDSCVFMSCINIICCNEFVWVQ